MHAALMNELTRADLDGWGTMMCLHPCIIIFIIRIGVTVVFHEGRKIVFVKFCTRCSLPRCSFKMDGARHWSLRA